MGVGIRLWAYLCATLPGSFFWLGVGLRIRLGFLWVIWLVIVLEWVRLGILIVGRLGGWMRELWRLDLVSLRLLELGLMEFEVFAGVGLAELRLGI
jgi:hypothetical protein